MKKLTNLFKRNTNVKLINTLLIFPVFPIFFTLMAWWGVFIISPEGNYLLFILLGLLGGTLVDFLVIKNFLSKSFSESALALSYIFYSICIFGFFMGVPVFNIFLAIPYSIYFYYFKSECLKRFALISTIIMIFVSLASTYFALSSSSTIADLEGMLNLPGTLNYPILYGIIIIGGIGLIISNYLLALFSGTLLKRFLMFIRSEKRTQRL